MCRDGLSCCLFRHFDLFENKKIHIFNIRRTWIFLGSNCRQKYYIDFILEILKVLEFIIYNYSK